MSDIRRIKRNKLQVKREGVNRVSTFEGRLEIENYDQNFNEKKIHSRKLRRPVIDDSRNIDLFSNGEDRDVDQVSLTGGRETIYGKKFSRIGTSRLRGFELTQEEQKLDRELENEDNFSITVMIVILVLCFVVGILLGYVLYRIAMNSSNVMFVITHYLT